MKQKTFIGLVVAAVALLSLITGVLIMTNTNAQNLSGNPLDHINDNNKIAVIETSMGTLKVELFNNVAPISVQNFIEIAEDGDYEGSNFHRVIENFMIQGGQTSESYTPIKGEFESNGVTNNLLHVRGVISMARTMVKDSATSQFFIMHKESPHLDGEYAAFGYLIEGYDVLDAIATTPVDYSDVPISTVTINSVTIRNKTEAEKELF